MCNIAGIVYQLIKVHIYYMIFVNGPIGHACMPINLKDILLFSSDKLLCPTTCERCLPFLDHVGLINLMSFRWLL
jgi:hypothetical protein